MKTLKDKIDVILYKYTVLNPHYDLALEKIMQAINSELKKIIPKKNKVPYIKVEKVKWTHPQVNAGWKLAIDEIIQNAKKKGWEV